jgi:hypothetical protein
MQNPRQYKIPDWFLNRQKDVVDGKYSQVSYLILFEMLGISGISEILNFYIFSLPQVPLTANCVKI